MDGYTRTSGDTLIADDEREKFERRLGEHAEGEFLTSGTDVYLAWLVRVEVSLHALAAPEDPSQVVVRADVEALVPLPRHTCGCLRPKCADREDAAAFIETHLAFPNVADTTCFIEMPRGLTLREAVEFIDRMLNESDHVIPTLIAQAILVTGGRQWPDAESLKN